MSKDEQKNVSTFIEDYLKNRKQIYLIIFLVDIRHTPTENDRLMYKYIIDSNYPCLIIANKADKIATTKVYDYVNNLQNLLNPLKDLTFLPFSSENKIYSQNVLDFLDKYLD